MRVVELRRRRPDDGEIETIARVYVSAAGGAAVIEPAQGVDLTWVRLLLDRGGVVDAQGRRLTPDDGARYVRGVAESFRGSRLWAERVKEDAP